MYMYILPVIYIADSTEYKKTLYVIDKQTDRQC